MRHTSPICLLLLAACTGAEAPAQLILSLAGGDGGLVVIGSPCTPDQESDPAFDGFSLREVSVQSFAGQPPDAPVCLAMGFQGRVSCPYGQDASGVGPDGIACKTPAGTPVKGAVPAQCIGKRPADTVIWSCRCADAAGRPSSVCTCPSGMACLPGVVQGIGPSTSNDGLIGAYCVRSSVASGPSGVCSTTCDPASRPCD